MTLLHSLLEPRSVVLMGASETQGVGGLVAANLLGSWLAGSIFVVGPEDMPGYADRCRRDVDELPITPDLAVICGPATTATEALDRAGRKGIRTAVVITAHKHGPDADTALKLSLTEAGRRHGCRFLGPGYAGINMPAVGLNASWMESRLAPGKLALVSQSASVAASVTEWASSRGIGLSRVISMGKEADIGVDEILRQLAADARTTSILLYLDCPSDGRAFVSSARAAARIKPVLVLKPGEGPILPAAGEAFVDPNAVYDAVFNRAGLLRVDDTAEWFDAAESLSRRGRWRAGKLAILSNGSGPARLAAGSLAAEGLLSDFADSTVATLQNLRPGAAIGNPLILGHDATAEDYATALATLCNDANLAAALVIYSPSPGASQSAVAHAIACVARETSVHMSACWFGPALDEGTRAILADANVALFDMPEKAARAFIHLDRYRRSQEALRQIPVSRRQELARTAANRSPARRPRHMLC